MNEEKPVEHNEVVEEEFHGGNKKKHKVDAVRSAPPRKQHHEAEVKVQEHVAIPSIDSIPHIPDATEHQAEKAVS